MVNRSLGLSTFSFRLVGSHTVLCKIIMTKMMRKLAPEIPRAIRKNTFPNYGLKVLLFLMVRP